MTLDLDLLNTLSEKAGILSSFTDRSTGITYQADTLSKQTILKSLGYPADTTEQIQKSLLKIAEEPYTHLINKTLVVTTDEQSDLKITLYIPADVADEFLVWKISLEQKGRFEDTVAIRNLPLIKAEEISTYSYQQRQLRLVLNLPIGYHKLEVKIKGTPYKETADLIIVPPTCYQSPALEGDKKVFGYPIQLYALKSERNWGIGDFTDLKSFVDVAHKTGAAFVGVNPLTALFEDNPDDASPYFPSSRLFLNPLYVDLENVKEVKFNSQFNDLKQCPVFNEYLTKARNSETVDYQSVAAIKKQAFKILFDTFLKRNFNAENVPMTKRAKDFIAFVKEKGDAIVSYALFQTMRNKQAKTGGSMFWREWEPGLNSVRASVAQDFLEENEKKAMRICYQQFVAFEQLDEVLKKSAKLPLGLYTDMPVGVSDNSAEVFYKPEAFLRHVTTGAPPDTFNLNGQDWSLAPFHPLVLKNTGFKAYRDILRLAMKGAGAVRVDHAFGLMRLYLRVKGGTGAYLKYPFKELTGILALESHLNKTVVIAEDLGTAPDGFSDEMMRLNAFSFKIMHYMRSWQGLMGPHEYPATSLIATGTHDLPSYTAFYKGLDLELGLKMGTISLEQYEKNKQNRETEKRLFLELFEKMGAKTGADLFDAPDEVPSDFILLIYRFLAQTNSKILLVRPEDVFEMDEQFNLPGTYMEHPNWRYKLKVPIEEMLLDKRLKSVVKEMKKERVSK